MLEAVINTLNASQATDLSVGMPVLYTSNPYQEKLLRHLVESNVNVDTTEFKTQFKKNLLKKNIQILHLNWIHSYLKARNSVNSTYRFFTLFLRLTIIRLSGIKIVWTVHNLKSHEDNYSPALDFLARLILTKLSKAIIVHCHVAQEKVTATFNVKPEKIFLIPHGNYIDLYPNEISRKVARKSLCIAADEKIILYMGIIRPYKGICQLIESFKTIESSNKAKLIIAGKILEERDVEAISSAIKGIDNIIFKPGYVPDQEVQIYMNACDVVALPYKNILTSGAAILAMSFRKPCIAPRIGCMEEFLGADGGFLYEPNDELGLNVALKKAIDSPFDLLEKMGNLNFTKAKAWDWKTVSEQFKQVYEYCLSSN
ncbi:glycosyltransferase [filamentous cyanobacterium CCT1]|nr:glycosyltransferase [filamentous cyanobacterium CCT1]PSN79758.1 glycosyltransferase [filamentous cyanobacterium CCP4]